jgi:ABC-type proline/glycine betaine transport system substrate-binding protein
MKLITAVRRTRGALLAALVALMMLGAAIPASADPGNVKPSNITWDSSAGGNRISFNITWD